MVADSTETARQHWRFVADAIPILICLIDQRGRVIRANRTVERWGLGKATTIEGRSLHDAMHPGCKTGDCYLETFEREVVSEIAQAHRTRLEVFDPQLRRHLAFSVEPTEPDEDHPDLDALRAVVSVDDRSELKRSQEHILHLQDKLNERVAHEMASRIEVEDVQTRLLNILSKTPNFIAMATPDGSLLYLNQSGRAMLRLADDAEAARLTMFDCLTPEARTALRDEALPAALRDGVWTGASALLARDGHRIPTTQVVIAHRSTDGGSAGFSIVEQDMTAWIESETALRRSQDELRELSSQLINIQEDERRRIAADLHDVIGQSLSLIKLSIDDAARLIRTGASEEAGEALIGLGAKVKDALVEVQRISMDLRPTTLDDLGILPTLSWFFREFESACRSVKVIREFSVREEDIPSPLKTTIFRLLQEASTNVVKHAGADEMRVGLSHSDGVLQLVIADNGRGFDPATLAAGDGPRQGLGLRSMKERARLSGASYVLESGVGRGTCIRASWPLTGG